MEFKQIRRQTEGDTIYQFKLHPLTRTTSAGKEIIALDTQGNFVYAENMIPLAPRQYVRRADGVIEGWLTAGQYEIYQQARVGLSEILEPITDF